VIWSEGVGTGEIEGLGWGVEVEGAVVGVPQAPSRSRAARAAIRQRTAAAYTTQSNEDRELRAQELP